MQSKNKPSMTEAERRHVQRVKESDCSVCDAAGPSDAHELKQGDWFTSVSLCRSCHMDPHFGIHGEKTMWRIKKMDELDALNVTLSRIYGPLKRVA